MINMKIPNNPFFGTKYIGKKEIKAVKKVMKSKSLFRYQGPNLQYMTNKFEDAMKKYLGVKYVLACSNGGAALKLSCIALGIGIGDEVLVPSFTFIASANSILSVGAVPKFVDIDETMNIDPKSLEKSISKRTKAIMVVHMQGVPANMKEIIKIAKKYNLKIIEDTAQALGAEIDGKKVGTFGDCGAFSLQAGKTITCGEGGFFATNNKELYIRAKMYHDNGGYRIGCDYPTWENKKTYFGENFKLTELQSAIALEQLKKINRIINKQEKNYQYIIKRIDTNYYKLRPLIEGSKSFKMSLAIIFDSKSECDRFIQYMNKNDIGFNIYCSNLIDKYDTFKYKNSWHKSGFPYSLTEYISTECKQSESLYKRVAWFNLSAELNRKHLKYIVSKLGEYKNERTK